MDNIHIWLTPEKAQLLLDVLKEEKPLVRIKQVFDPLAIEIAIRKAKPIRRIGHTELHPLLKQYYQKTISFEDKRSLFRYIWEQGQHILDNEDKEELYSMKKDGWLGVFHDDE